DGVADLIVGSGPGRVAEVRIFDGTNGQMIRSVQPFADFTGGTFVAAGDFNNDGKADVIVTPDLSGGPRVSIVSGADGSQVANFFAGNVDNRGGVRVAVKDLDGDAKADVVVGDGNGAGSHVTTYLGKNIATNGTPPSQNSFDAFAG